MKTLRIILSVLVVVALCGFRGARGSGSGSSSCSGDINTACSQVTSGAHLANGSVASLAIAPLTAWTAPTGIITNQAITANTYIVTGYIVPFPLTFSKITYRIGVIDGAHNSDVCVWNSSGTLIANIGAQALGTVASNTTADVQGSQTIPAGIYFFGATSAASTVAFSGQSGNSGNAALTVFTSGSYGTSSGGACANITAPTIAIKWNAEVGSTALAIAMALS